MEKDYGEIISLISGTVSLHYWYYMVLAISSLAFELKHKKPFIFMYGLYQFFILFRGSITVTVILMMLSIIWMQFSFSDDGLLAFREAMGKRKSRAKPAPKKRMDKLDTVFSCPFCNHGTSVECRM